MRAQAEARGSWARPSQPLRWMGEEEEGGEGTVSRQRHASSAHAKQASQQALPRSTQNSPLQHDDIRAEGCSSAARQLSKRGGEQLASQAVGQRQVQGKAPPRALARGAGGAGAGEEAGRVLVHAAQ